MWICNFLRRRALRSCASKVPTAIIPLSGIHSATVLVDAAESSCEDCVRAVQVFFKSRGVKLKIFYTYLKKLEKDAEPPVDRNSALLLSDLDWCGRPSLSRLSVIAGPESDLFISLTGEKTYQTEFVACWFPARFKMGRFPLPVFDVVLDGREAQTQTEVFHSIEDLFTKIK